MIHDQHLFSPVIDYVLTLEPHLQPGMFYIVNGVLSAISDNVFVATVYINEVNAAFLAGDLTRNQFDLLGVAIKNRYKNSKRRNTERPGRFLVSPNIVVGTAHQTLVRTDGIHGFTLHTHKGGCRLDGGSVDSSVAPDWRQTDPRSATLSRLSR
ncbi:MAG: hypothetical protein Ct9H300mP8_07590 [Gammaproteobacteria bacterium]|nr:MAG: hypothetical protein Ct9H300mP8_07590 [Gammaproteobacteria bacterium]